MAKANPTLHQLGCDVIASSDVERTISHVSPYHSVWTKKHLCTLTLPWVKYTTYKHSQNERFKLQNMYEESLEVREAIA